MNKTTEALKLAENTLRDIIRVYEFEGGTPVTALAAIREALADHSGDANETAVEPVKQEPVAEIIGFERTIDIRGVKRIPRIKWNVPLWEDESPLQLGNLYAAPVSVEAIRAEALEEAAKVCESTYPTYESDQLPCFDTPAECAAAIRGLK